MKLHDINNYITDWIYLERYVNDGSDHQYKNQNDVPYKFQPRSNTEYIEVKSLIGTKKSSWNEKINETEFPIHPYMSKYYENQGYKFTNTFLRAIPSSSTRSLFINDIEPYFLKFDLPVKISRFERHLVKSDMLFSKQIDDIFKNWNQTNSNFGFGVLRETSGGYFKDKLGREPSYIKRAIKPTWLTSAVPKGPYYMIPSFSLISRDSKKPNDFPLVVQLAQNSGINAVDFTFEYILKPIFDFWNLLASEGLIWEMQGQNTLLVINKIGMPCGIVIRDYDAVYINTEIRNNSNDKTPYIKHTLKDKQSLMERNSLVFDHRLCKQNLMRIISCIGQHYGQKVTVMLVNKVQAYMDDHMDYNLTANLPPTHWYTYPDVMFTHKIKTIQKPNPPLRKIKHNIIV